jgi:dihydrofolate reductase
MSLSMIWAMGKNREIGKDLEIPWHIPEDFKYFKKTTLGKPVIMGLKTYDSMGKALPGRRNIVLDFNELDLPDAELVTDISKIPEMFRDGDAFIIGGGSIYKLFLDKVDKLYMTYIDHEFDANIFFPEFDVNEWKLISEEKGIMDDKNPYDYYFRVYVKK